MNEKNKIKDKINPKEEKKEDKIVEIEEKKEEKKEEDNGLITIKRSEYDELLKKLKEQEDICKEYKDLIQRKEADYQNYRKKLIKEKEEYIKYANYDLVLKLLPITDNLKRALTFNENFDDIKPLVDGIELILKQFMDTLKKIGVEEIQKMEKFDHYYHEVIETEETNKVPEGTILEVLQTGYKYYDKILRPSLVRVSKSLPEESKEVKESENIEG